MSDLSFSIKFIGSFIIVVFVRLQPWDHMYSDPVIRDIFFENVDKIQT